MYGKEVSLSALLSGLSATRGGKRLQQLRDTVMTALSLKDTMQGMPRIFGADKAASLSGDVTMLLTGADLLVPAADAPKQTFAKKRIWEDPADDTKYTDVQAILPGKMGNNIEVTVTLSVGAAAIVESDLDTDTPKVEIQYQAGDHAATLAAINTSKVIRGVAGAGGGGIMAAISAFQLEKGYGEGVRYYLGKLLVQDGTQMGTLFAGSDDARILEWAEDQVKLIVESDHLGVDKALLTAPTAAEGQVLLRLEWAKPLFEATFPLNVVA